MHNSRVTYYVREMKSRLQILGRFENDGKWLFLLLSFLQNMTDFQNRSKMFNRLDKTSKKIILISFPLLKKSFIIILMTILLIKFEFNDFTKKGKHVQICNIFDPPQRFSTTFFCNMYFFIRNNFYNFFFREVISQKKCWAG